jgi:hypothetical protein
VLTGIAPEVWADTGFRGIATAEEVIRELHSGKQDRDGEGRVMGG